MRVPPKREGLELLRKGNEDSAKRVRLESMSEAKPADLKGRAKELGGFLKRQLRNRHDESHSAKGVEDTKETSKKTRSEEPKKDLAQLKEKSDVMMAEKEPALPPGAKSKKNNEKSDVVMAEKESAPPPGSKSKKNLELQQKEKGSSAPACDPKLSTQLEQQQTSLQGKVGNLKTFANSSAQNKYDYAEEIYNGVKDSRTTTPVHTAELLLQEKYGIPVGTATKTLEEVYSSGNLDKHVPRRIRDIIQGALNDGNVLSALQQDLKNNQNILDQLKQPNCQSVSLPPQPTATALPSNPAELANWAIDHGGDLMPQRFRYLATLFTGTDHGDNYSKVYNTFYDDYLIWASTPAGNGKPTEHGFLTSVIDVMMYGTTTVPIERDNRSGQTYSIGVQYNFGGATTDVQVGTMNNPGILTVYSTKPPEGIEKFNLPPKTPSTQPSSQPTSNASSVATTSIVGASTPAQMSSPHNDGPVSVGPSLGKGLAHPVQQSHSPLTLHPIKEFQLLS